MHDLRRSFEIVTKALVWIVLCSPALSQAPPTIEESLQARGVPQSLPALRQALQDSRPEVRGMAASTLAARNDRQSIPLIKVALGKAQGAMEKVNLGQALLQLGDPYAINILQNVCEDDQARAEFRLEAANHLAESGNSACAGSVVTVLVSTSDHSIRAFAMRLLMRNNEMLSAPSTAQLEKGLGAALEDEVPSNRQLAGECIAHFKLSASRTELRAAVSRERDIEVKNRLQESLAILDRATP